MVLSYSNQSIDLSLQVAGRPIFRAELLLIDKLLIFSPSGSSVFLVMI